MWFISMWILSYVVQIGSCFVGYSEVCITKNIKVMLLRYILLRKIDLGFDLFYSITTSIPVTKRW